eukprot:1136662-Pelagomonas_calceolata.AAC.4
MQNEVFRTDVTSHVVIACGCLWSTLALNDRAGRPGDGAPCFTPWYTGLLVTDSFCRANANASACRAGPWEEQRYSVQTVHNLNAGVSQQHTNT